MPAPTNTSAAARTGPRPPWRSITATPTLAAPSNAVTTALAVNAARAADTIASTSALLAPSEPARSRRPAGTQTDAANSASDDSPPSPPAAASTTLARVTGPGRVGATSTGFFGAVGSTASMGTSSSTDASRYVC